MTTEQELLEVIDERDRYAAMADQLACAISQATGVEIGEHTNVNDPWQNALDAIRVARLLPQGAGAVAKPAPCECALLPLGGAPVEPCVKPSGHDGLHQTARGVQWADPDDEEG